MVKTIEGGGGINRKTMNGSREDMWSLHIPITEQCGLQSVCLLLTLEMNSDSGIISHSRSRMIWVV